MKKLLFLFIPFFVLACENDLLEVDALGENIGIIGTWVEEVDISLPSPGDGVTLLRRSENLDTDSYGFILHDDGSFTEHKNAGWCGTPPIAYDNFEGTWVPLSDTVLDITVGYWGGTLTYQMHIVSLDGNELGIRYLFSEDRVETK